MYRDDVFCADAIMTEYAKITNSKMVIEFFIVVSLLVVCCELCVCREFDCFDLSEGIRGDDAFASHYTFSGKVCCFSNILKEKSVFMGVFFACFGICAWDGVWKSGLCRLCYVVSQGDDIA